MSLLRRRAMMVQAASPTPTEIWSYKYPDDSYVVLDAVATDYSDTIRYNNSPQQNGRRKCIFSTIPSGTALENVGTVDSQTSPPLDHDVYLFPVPSTATRLVCKITPTSQYVGVGGYTYDPQTGKYTRVLNSGWFKGSYSTTFTAGTYDYISVTMKYNSSGTTYPTPPSAVSLEFS